MLPLVISHRACAGHAPENTLSGIRYALDLGADAVEVDVQATADGVPVLMHDPSVDRTTDGGGDLRSLTLDHLRSLDAAGAQTGPDGPPSVGGRLPEPPPTFAEALDLTRGGALLVPEIKRPGCEDALAGVVRDAGALDEVMVWSFLPPALEAMRLAEPRLPAALLIAPQSIPNWPSMRRLAVRLGLQGVSVFHRALDERIVAQARRAGLSVYAYTADSEDDLRRLIDLGVDGIVTDFPDRALKLLKRGRTVD